MSERHQTDVAMLKLLSATIGLSMGLGLTLGSLVAAVALVLG